MAVASVQSVEGVLGIPSQALIRRHRPMPQFPRLGVMAGWGSASPPSWVVEGDSPLRPPRLKSDSSLTLGDVTSLNLTMLEGGVSFNVVPSEMAAGFDVRIPPTVDLKVDIMLPPPRRGVGWGVPHSHPSSGLCLRPLRSRWPHGARVPGMVSPMSFSR